MAKTKRGERAALQRALDEIAQEMHETDGWGMPPEDEALSRVDLHQFGIAVAFPGEGVVASAGDAQVPFSIQSISKILSLELAHEAIGDALWKRVGREPSGNPFDTVIDLEQYKGYPRNPLVNAGALVVIDLLVSKYGSDEAAHAVRSFVEKHLDGDKVTFSDEVIESSRQGGDQNTALMHIARHFGNFDNEPAKVMLPYVLQCAMELSCHQLARLGLFLIPPEPPKPDDADQRRIKRARRILSLMLTCGMYDGSGEFAYRTGLPAKSGVGGGILAVVPGTASIGVWSPGLDEAGNSRLGVMALERLSDRMNWSVFANRGPV
ncbi:glutaminase A [Pararhodobacter sp. SW119]|uniref:glutaminase A n=1 Tax=Pararhodobacter sp. SW119 TaxID=2780075 RepID=UPI001ADEF544|nr:glutaminase A [Pararhodobacter sp. SW119]